MAQISRVEFRTKAQIVFDELRRRIVAGILEPGERLLLRPIAEEFECSEIPVREAFRSLAAAGFVDLVPHGGAHVCALRVEEIIELTEVRAILEPEATIAAMPHIGATAVRELGGILNDMEAAAGRGDSAAYGKLNRKFHARIIEHCPNSKLVCMIKDLWDRAERGRLVFRDASHISESLAHHRDMLAHIANQNATALRRVVTDHSQFWLAAVRRLAETPIAPVRASAARGRR